MNPAVAVQVQDLSRTYSLDGLAQPVLESISTVIDAGTRVALLGPSGSGKSTFLNLLAGIDRPDGGEIRLGDFVMTAADDRHRTLYRRRHIGFVFQAFNLVPTLTVQENVELPLVLQQSRGDGRGDTLARVREVLEQVDVAHLHGRYPDALSGGEQQRVAVARAVVHRPGLILADEPTGNLDRANAERVLDLLIRLTAERAATLLLATHSMAAASLADRVLTVIDHGLREVEQAAESV